MIYSQEQYAEKLKAEGATKKKGVKRMITAIKQEVVDGVTCLVVYMNDLRPDGGEEFGLVMDRKMAEELTKAFGPNALVEKFFRLN